MVGFRNEPVPLALRVDPSNDTHAVHVNMMALQPVLAGKRVSGRVVVRRDRETCEGTETTAPDTVRIAGLYDQALGKDAALRYLLTRPFRPPREKWANFLVHPTALIGNSAPLRWTWRVPEGGGAFFLAAMGRDASMTMQIADELSWRLTRERPRRSDR